MIRSPHLRGIQAPSGRLSLRKNFSWTLSANVLFGVYQWFLIACIARLAGPSLVGEYALALALIVPLQLILNLQLGSLQASDVKDSFSFSSYYTLRIITTAMLVMIVMVTVTLVDIPVGRMVLLCLLFVKVIESIADVFYGAFQKAERMDYAARARMLGAVGGGIAFGVSFYLARNLWISLLCIGLIQVLILSFYTLRIAIARKGEFGINLALERQVDNLVKLGKYALPLGIAISVISVNSTLPRWFLGHFHTNYEVGIFEGLYQLMIAGTITVGAMGRAITPTIARLVQTGEVRAFHKIVGRLVVGCILVGIGAALVASQVGEAVLAAAYGSAYAEHDRALMMLALASGFLFGGSFVGYGLTAGRVLREQSWVFLITTAFSLIGLSLVVPKHGIEGAALVTCVTAAIQCGTIWALLRAKIRVN